MDKTIFGNGKVVWHMLAGAVMISFSGVWVKLAHVPPTTSAFYRVFFGGVFLLALVLKRGELQHRIHYHLLLGLICGTAFALDLFFFHRSILLIGPGLATILPNFQIFILSGIGILFLGENIRLKFAIAVPLAFFGLFLIVGMQWGHLDPLYHRGIYYGFAAAVFYSIFILLLRKLQGAESGISIYYILMLVSFASAAWLGVDILATGASLKIPDLQSGISLLLLGVSSQAIGWILITNSLPKLRASFAGLILLLQPSLAFVWDVIFFGRPTSLVNWMGVAITVTAIYLGLTAGTRRQGQTDLKFQKS